MRPVERYVAIGDSTVEGLDDPLPSGGYRGWADRLAQRIADVQGSVLYANLAIRGRTTRQVRAEQLASAVALRPDLAVVVSGMNDLLRRTFNPVALRADIEAMQTDLAAAGATVLTFTLPDLGAVVPIARLVRDRVVALNDAIRGAAAVSGAIVCDLASYAVTIDPRLWSTDRLHANSEGHARIAEALAWSLGLPGSSDSWSAPLDGPVPSGVLQSVRSEIAWLRLHLLPWIWRHARGRSSGDGRHAKLPQLTRIESVATAMAGESYSAQT